MKLVFMGTPPFAEQALRALAASGHQILAVVTRVDKPSGRGKVLAAPSVKVAAVELGIPVLQPVRIKDPAVLNELTLLRPDVIVVAAYGQILSREILSLPRFGCLNIHASLLPAWRGASPINHAIMNGDTETGITIMQMDEGMDTGAILLQASLPIELQDTTGSLAEKLSLLGARLILDALVRIEIDGLTPIAQDDSIATFAPLLKKHDGRINWTSSATQIKNRVRGLSPWPGAFTTLDGKTFKILEADVISGTDAPGKISIGIHDTIVVGTGDMLLSILRLQPEGKKGMTAGEFLRGQRAITGKNFA